MSGTWSKSERTLGSGAQHAPEDHFGALIVLWPRLKVPIYATPFTAALLEAKCAASPVSPKIPLPWSLWTAVSTSAVQRGAGDDGAFHSGIERVIFALPAALCCTPATGRSIPTTILRDPTDVKEASGAGPGGDAWPWSEIQQCRARRALAIGG